MMDQPPATPVQDWKRPARLLALGVGGAVGILSRFVGWPRWIGMTVAAASLVVWFVLGFEWVKPGETETQRRQRMRNIAIALTLAGMVALFYFATMARLGSNALNRPL